MWCSSENGIKINEAFDKLAPAPLGANIDDVSLKGSLGFSITAL